MDMFDLSLMYLVGFPLTCFDERPWFYGNYERKAGPVGNKTRGKAMRRSFNLLKNHNVSLIGELLV